MSVWENTPTTLISFRPPSTEPQSSKKLFNRIFKRGKDEAEQSSASDGGSSQSSSREVSLERNVSREQLYGQSLNVTESFLERSLNVSDQQFESSKRVERIANAPDTDKSKIGKAVSELDLREPRVEITRVEPGDSSKRTLTSVITRLSAILDRRAPTPQVYRDSDFKQYWMPDSSCRECYDCHDKFTTFRRRHHCRICGQIFCNSCCSQELPGKVIGYKGSIRVCRYCYNIVQHYAEKVDPSGDPKVTKEVLYKYLESDVALSPEQLMRNQSRSALELKRSLSLRSPSEGDINIDSTAPFDLTPQSEFVVTDNFSSERKLLVQDSQQLRNLWTLMMDTEQGVEFHSSRVRLRTYQKCITGNRIVDWLIKQDKVSNRAQAIAIGQALIDAAFLDRLHVMSTPFRDDFTLYRPTEFPVFDVVSPEMNTTSESFSEDSAPQWFQEIKTNDTTEVINDPHLESIDIYARNYSYSDLSQDSRGNIAVDERHFDEPILQQNLIGTEDVVEPLFGAVVTETAKSIQSSVGSWKTLDHESDDASVQEAFEQLQQEHHEHLTALTQQLLYEENLAGGWSDIIIQTVDRVSLFVKPDVKNNSDDMDIRKYVHIKKIPGGKREQTALIHGVIFHKNVAHKKMARNINNPGVLLLQGSIEYQRVENKISYLEPQILQEEEFLYKNIQKITSLKPRPDILVVEKSVSRLAQNFLLKAGITLIYNVKQTVMERLSRFLDTVIVTSIDSLVRGVKLGLCHTFSVRNLLLPSGDMKSMLQFDGCATHLGCAITVRGGSVSELKRVKKIMSFMIYASYHSHLEISFCMDEFLKPPLKDKIEFDLDKIGSKIGKNIKQSSDNNEGFIDTKVIKMDEQDCYKGTEMEGKDKDTLEENSDVYASHVISSAIFNKQDFSEIAQSLEEFNVKQIQKFEVGSVGDMQHVCDNLNNNCMLGNQENTNIDGIQRHVFDFPRTTSESFNIEYNSESKPSLTGSESIEYTERSQSSSCSGELKERTSSFIIMKIDERLNNNIFNNLFENVNSEEILKQSETCDIIPQLGTSSLETVQSGNNKNRQLVPDRQLVLRNSNIPDKCSDVDLLIKLLEPNSDKTEKTDMNPDVKRRNTSGQKRDKSPSTHRKSEAKTLTDHSDPLHNYQINKDESIFHSSMAFQEQLITHRTKFRNALDNVLLSTSPYIQYHLPYLETEMGSKCELRQYFPEEIYWSAHFGLKSGQRKSKNMEFDLIKKAEPQTNIQIREAHEFIRFHLTRSARDYSTQYILAKFRAYGGRIKIIDDQKSDDSQSKKYKENQMNKGKSFPLDLPKGDNIVPVDNRFVDCLDPYGHQRIAVLFSSFSYNSENHPSPCVYPWVVTMEFYGKNDTTLGGFLERFCFRPSYVCPSSTCNTPMECHQRKFVHGNGCISLILKKLDHPIPNAQSTILMWSWCFKCKQTTPVVQMATSTWNLSFSRYLELRFHGGNFHRRVGADPLCTHSLHHEHFQYFGFKDTVASFKYSTIKVKEIKLPKLLLTLDAKLETIILYRQNDEVKRQVQKITDIFSQAMEYLGKLIRDSLCDHLNKSLADCITHIQIDKNQIKELAQVIKEKLNVLLTEEGEKKTCVLSSKQRDIYNQIEDGLTQLKHCMMDAVNNWNTKLQDIYMQQKKSKQGSNQKKDKDRDSASMGGSTLTLDVEDEPVLPSIRKNVYREMGAFINTPPPFSEDLCSLSESNLYDLDDERKISDFTVSYSPSYSLSPPRSFEDSIETLVEVFPESTAIGTDRQELAGQSEKTTLVGQGIKNIDNEEKHTETNIKLEQCENTSVVKLDYESFRDVKVPQDDKEYDVKSQDVKGLGIKVNLKGSDTKHQDMKPSCIKEMEVRLQEVKEPEDRSEDIKSQELSEGNQKIIHPETLIPKKVSSEDQLDSLLPGDKIGVIKKTLMNTIWQGSGAFQLQMPFDACDHYMLPPCDRMPVVVYDHEPSSIIAYSLSSHDYHVKLYDIQASQRNSKSDVDSVDKQVKEEMGKRPSSSKLSFLKGSGLKDGGTHQDLPDTVKFIKKSEANLLESPQDDVDFPVFTTSMSEGDKSKAAKQTVNHHIELQFSDSTARFYCKVYFAEQFRHLRKLVLEDGEDMYIRSLSRCKLWEAKGGKSGSSFCKTDDDRFILKQMSYMEVDSFERFGPEYFQYIASAEKLQTFDLKGSERNRLVKQSRKRDEDLVLLDENFLKVSVDCPLYIQPYSKTILMLAIGHDSQFLASNLVMDYSLLVGLDEQKKELVVGIIDYIRTFTWDKKLETILKSNFGGQGKMPTVVSPEVYKTRFLDAMAKYFLPVPDQWIGLGLDVEN